jgi:hypothetical protein
VYQVNNSVTFFSGEPIGSEEFLKQMVEAFGIIIDRRPKGRLRKDEKLSNNKNRMYCPILIIKIEGEEEK